MGHDRATKEAKDTVAELQVRLGASVRRQRVSNRVDQEHLALRAGVGRTAVSRIENGNGGTIASLLAVIRALDREDWIDSLAPQVAVSPMDLIRRSRAAPQRVRRSQSSDL